jgi:ADP-ribosylglycohydrolase
MAYLTSIVLMFSWFGAFVAFVGSENTPSAAQKTGSTAKLFSKIYGCEAAATIANSMGDVTEGLSYKEIEKRYGFVDRLLPQDKKDRRSTQKDGSVFIYHAHRRPPGMTEDGQERHRLCTSAIIKKGGRITITDLAEAWKTGIDPTKFGYLLGPQDRVIYDSINAGMPPWDVGRLAAWPGFIGTTKMILPVGMVNACNPSRAAQDAFELGRLKDVRGVKGNYALEACAGIAAAAAEALKPNATVESVISTALSYLSEEPLKEVQQGLTWAKEAKDWKELRPLYEEKYNGRPISNAVEVMSGGLACFYVAKGRPKEAILYAVNLGRDTDCKGYIAGGLAGALMGIEAVPGEWVRIIEEEVVNDPYTVSRRTARESAEGLYQAAANTIAEMKRIVRMADFSLPE